MSCTIWSGCLNDLGYGRKRVGGRVIGAHRWTWEQANGPIPEGMVVMHTCDNRACVNLDHLRLGTQAENIEDMLAKRRQRGALGEANAKSKLTESEVRDVRERRSEGDTLQAIADDYGITVQSVWAVVHRKTWTHV